MLFTVFRPSTRSCVCVVLCCAVRQAASLLSVELRREPPPAEQPDSRVEIASERGEAKRENRTRSRFAIDCACERTPQQQHNTRTRLQSRQHYKLHANTLAWQPFRAAALPSDLSEVDLMFDSSAASALPVATRAQTRSALGARVFVCLQRET